MSAVLRLALVCSLLLLCLSPYPGLTSDAGQLALLLAPFWLPVFCVGSVVYLDLFTLSPGLIGPRQGRRRWLIWGLFGLVANLTLMAADVPRRLAFLVSLPGFVQGLETTAARGFQEIEFDRRVGLYHVDRVAADPRGGVYYRTHQGLGGLSSRALSYGFAHAPNRDGCPFGDRKYRLWHVLGGWYGFRAGPGN